MDKSEIVTLIQFNFWANRRILETCERISLEQLNHKLTPDPGWGDLRTILVHILDTEYGWRTILQSQNADDILEAADFANVAALKTRWEVERSAWLEYVAGLSEESINQGYGADNRDGQKVWQTILHVITHGIQHHSEAATILTGYGQSPGELDFDVFLKEKPDYTEENFLSKQPGVKFLYLFCDDLQEMRFFYSDLIGLNEIYYSEGPEGAVAYDCDGLQFTIFSDETNLTIPQEWACQPGWKGGSQPVISWSVVLTKSGFREAVHRALDANVETFYDEPKWHNYWSFPIKDPMGNTVEIVLDSREKIIWDE